MIIIIHGFDRICVREWGFVIDSCSIIPISSGNVACRINSLLRSACAINISLCLSRMAKASQGIFISSELISR